MPVISSRQPSNNRQPPHSEHDASFLAETSSLTRRRPSSSIKEEAEHDPLPLSNHILSQPDSPSSNDDSPRLLHSHAKDPSTIPSHLLLPVRNSEGLTPRQEVFFALPASYKGLNAGPSPGTVVGITLGAVIGYLLILYLIQTALSGKRMKPRYIEADASEIAVTRRSHSRSGGKRRRQRPRARTATVESQSQSDGATNRQPSPRRTERIIREEVRVRQESRPPPPVQMPGMPDMRETINININERGARVDGDDVVEVIEEHSDVDPAPRRNRRDGSRGAYRTVDPGAYGGGNYPSRPVRR